MGLIIIFYQRIHTPNSNIQAQIANKIVLRFVRWNNFGVTKNNTFVSAPINCLQSELSDSNVIEAILCLRACCARQTRWLVRHFWFHALEYLGNKGVEVPINNLIFDKGGSKTALITHYCGLHSRILLLVLDRED